MDKGLSKWGQGHGEMDKQGHGEMDEQGHGEMDKGLSKWTRARRDIKVGLVTVGLLTSLRLDGFKVGLSQSMLESEGGESSRFESGQGEECKESVLSKVGVC